MEDLPIGRKVFTNKDGESVYEGVARPDNMDFLSWLQNERDGMLSRAMMRGDQPEQVRISGLSDDDLAKELGMYSFPAPKKEEGGEAQSDQRVAS